MLDGSPSHPSRLARLWIPIWLVGVTLTSTALPSYATDTPLAHALFATGVLVTTVGAYLAGLEDHP